MTEPKTNNSMDKKDEDFKQEDIDKNKNIAGLSYIIFFLPLIACPESRFGRFHANQALNLFILGVGGAFILSIIPYLGWRLLPALYIITLLLMVMGLVNGFGGKVKELPIIGRFKLLK